MTRSRWNFRRHVTARDGLIMALMVLAVRAITYGACVIVGPLGLIGLPLGLLAVAERFFGPQNDS